MTAVRTHRPRTDYRAAAKRQREIDDIVLDLELLRVERFGLETQPPAWAEALHERMQRMDAIHAREQELHRRLAVLTSGLGTE